MTLFRWWGPIRKWRGPQHNNNCQLRQTVGKKVATSLAIKYCGDTTHYHIIIFIVSLARNINKILLFFFHKFHAVWLQSFGPLCEGAKYCKD